MDDKKQKPPQKTEENKNSPPSTSNLDQNPPSNQKPNENSQQKKVFNYKLGLRKRDKKKIVEATLKHGILTKEEIEKVIKSSTRLIKQQMKRKKCNCYNCRKEIANRNDEKNVFLCSGCKNYIYCSRECQQLDWKKKKLVDGKESVVGHKINCKMYRYCREDRELYLWHNESGTKLEYIPEKEKVHENLGKFSNWNDYFFVQRFETFYKRVLKKLKEKYKGSIKEKEFSKGGKGVKWMEFPEFRIATNMLSFSCSIYRALRLRRIVLRNKVISIIIPYNGASNVDLLKSVKELCMLSYNVKTLGITFVGLAVPTKTELSTVTFESLSNCSVYFWKKKYNYEEMISASKPDLIVLHQGILYDKLEPLYDLIVNSVNVLILFNQKKYYEITKKLIVEVMKIPLKEEDHGFNEFGSFENSDPCKRVDSPLDFFSENKFFICLNHKATKEEKDYKKKNGECLIEARFKSYLQAIIERGKKMNIEEIYFYLIGVKFGFAKHPKI